MIKLAILVATLVTVTWGAPPVNVNSRNPGGRVIGGNDTTIEEYPFMASLILGQDHICGGVILSSTWILTVAHCIITDASAYSVRVGSTNRNSGGEVIAAARILMHENYMWYSMDFDVALVELATPITNPVSRPGVLAAEEDMLIAGTTVTVSGWGEGLITDVLQVVQVPIISQESCRAAYGETITDRMICTGVEGKGPCYDDGGGPLISNGVVTGLVLGGIICASEIRPSIYVNVPAVRSWIRQNSGI